MFVVLMLIVAFLLLGLLLFLLGFRLGGEHWLTELNRVKTEALLAERELHNLTRQAFVAMAERADQQRRGAGINR